MDKNLVDNLIKKCDDNKIKYEVFTDESDEISRITLYIQGGRASYPCHYIKDSEIKMLLSSNFELYNFINNYEAIWSSKNQSIECGIYPLNNRGSRRFLLRSINDAIKRSNEESRKADDLDKPIKIPFSDNIDLSIGPCSIEYMSMILGRDRIPWDIETRPTIKIININIDKHDEALNNLQTIGNSILFQLDLMLEFPLLLGPEREGYFERRRRIGSTPRPVKVEITEPKHQYDNDPISLYWYAKSTSGMPLIQFLAYYQIIEYYFPIYSLKESHEKIKDYLKDPRFDANSDTHISKLLNLIVVSRDGNLFGNEEKQLGICIKACTDNDELRGYINSNQKLNKFFNDKKSLIISKKKISVDNENADVINEITHRIYDIRCKIVHRKSNEDDVINPFSPEARLIYNDIELVEFIARKILIKSSKPLTIFKIN